MTYDAAIHDPASADPAPRGRSHDVGYGKPPLHTRFQLGRSGNPGGRPRRTGTERVKQLALDGAYREVAIDEVARAGRSARRSGGAARRDDRYFSNSLLFSLFSGKSPNGHTGVPPRGG
jgi:uncharacterized protein DUF5681